MNRIHHTIRFIRWHLGHTIPMIMQHASTYPELPRKSWLRRYAENLYIYLRDGSPCAAYDGLGLDIKGRPLDDFVGNHVWMRFLDRKLTPEKWRSATALQKLVFRGKSQIPILQDKFLFWCFMDAHGIPVVPILAHTACGEIFEHPSEGAIAKHARFFVKPAGEMCGSDARPVTAKDGKLYEGGRETSLAAIASSKTSLVFQPFVENHPDIKVLNPETLNTMRFVTCRNRQGGLEPWDPGMMRIGRAGSTVDNFAKGGVGVGIDTDGRLKKHGFSHDKELNYVKMECHPDSGIAFEGRPVPFYRDAVALTLKAHALFPTLDSIGWDVAITPNGPLLLEGNHAWDVEMLQVVHRKGSAARFRVIFGENPR